MITDKNPLLAFILKMSAFLKKKMKKKSLLDSSWKKSPFIIYLEKNLLFAFILKKIPSLHSSWKKSIPLFAFISKKVSFTFILKNTFFWNILHIQNHNTDLVTSLLTQDMPKATWSLKALSIKTWHSLHLSSVSLSTPILDMENCSDRPSTAWRQQLQKHQVKIISTSPCTTSAINMSHVSYTNCDFK